MSRKAILLGTALLTLIATAPTIAGAKEPASRSWGDYLRSWPDSLESWRDPLRLHQGAPERMPPRRKPQPFFTELKPKPFVYQGPGPHMPVDDSFDEIVESDQPWPTTGEH